MISEFGLAGLWIAAALAALQLIFAIVGIRRDKQDLMMAVRPIAVAQGLFVGLAFLCLIIVFIQSDMSV